MKSLIIKKANSLFLKYGFKSVTMDELALSLGMSKKTLYIHFDCKNDIVEASALDIFEKANKELILVRKKSENAIHEFHSVFRKCTTLSGTLCTMWWACQCEATTMQSTTYYEPFKIVTKIAEITFESVSL